ncbi:Conserved_hypothetical protein [Hexamita inflata]|uniref:Uncharacterized protein n=1 Tax=Hexamita inflata TaxID=28002 RepID=A0AA86U6U4_9EUKA|nr:Conserved hypothetical protein [Hexamita inflata]CAI9947869.1 Conserved hypothetical protein [Hexamita inflata]
MSIFVSIKIYTLQPNQTPDSQSPQLKFCSTHQFSLDVADVLTLADFCQECQTRIQTGYLKSQYFRIFQINEILTGNFIDSTEQLLRNLKKPFVDLGIIRYTKAQALMLQQKVSAEELVILDSVINQRRVYNKIKKDEKYQIFSYAQAKQNLINNNIQSDQMAALHASGIVINQIQQIQKVAQEFKGPKKQLIKVDVPIQHLHKVQLYLAQLLEQE